MWNIPTPEKYFNIPSQPYLNVDWEIYKKLGHHTGIDYGGQKQTNIPLFACANGEIIYEDSVDSAWGKFLGNHIALYIPTIDKTFLYCHMAEKSNLIGKTVKAGQQIGIMGNTGISAGNAIHLHLEGWHGYFKIAMRSFKSLEDIKTKTFDADKIIRENLTNFQV